MGIKLVTPPSSEPVTLAEAKLHVKQENETADDDLIASLNKAAREYAEAFTMRQFMPATWRLSLPSFYHRLVIDRDLVQLRSGLDYRSTIDPRYGVVTSDEIFLPFPPLISITSIQYVDTNGVLQTLNASDYQLDDDEEPAIIAPAYGLAWPVTRPVYKAVRITYQCGYANAALVPEGIKAAIKMLLGHWYENREEVVTGTIATRIPVGVDRILQSYWTGELDAGR